ncbi:hypothetical protein [Nostoc sp.]|uniref:hypothetical protein n=1 Tax=Nostoc sp. TaxID=1180 RepID=UPI002FF77A26
MTNPGFIQLMGGVDSSGRTKALLVSEEGKILSEKSEDSTDPNISSIERVPEIKKVSDQNVISGGKKMVFIANIGAADGLLLGTEFLPGDSISLEATGNDTIAEISYNATNTIFMIVTLT